MTRSRLLLGVASVLAGTTALLGVFGLVYNPVLLLAAVPFAAATYLLWSHATGRLEARMRERAARAKQGADRGRAGGRGTGGAGPAWETPGTDGGAGRARGARARDRRASYAAGGPTGSAPGDAPSRSAAARVLGVEPEADEATVRRAFREKARELHPDAPEGDEAEFRRVRAAYERLVDRG